MSWTNEDMFRVTDKLAIDNLGEEAYLAPDGSNGISVVLPDTKAWGFGVDGTGTDCKFFGDTASTYVLWDESADSMIWAGEATLAITTIGVQSPLSIGSWATPIALTDTVTRLVLINSTVTAKLDGATYARALEVRTVIAGAAAFDAGESIYAERANLKFASTATHTVSSLQSAAIWANLEAEVSSAAVITLNGDAVNLHGLLASIELDADMTCTDGNVSGVKISSNTPDGLDVSGLEYDALKIAKGSGGEDWQTAMRIEDCTKFVLFEDDNAIAAEDGAVATATAITAISSFDGWIKCAIGTADHYILTTTTDPSAN